MYGSVFHGSMFGILRSVCKFYIEEASTYVNVLQKSGIVIVVATPAKILACTQISQPSLVFSLIFANSQAHFMIFLKVVWPLLLSGLTIFFWHV